MIIAVDHPAVTGGLALSYGAEGLDRFGRILDEKWTTGDGETLAVVDEFGYAYDLSGNRTWRDVRAAPFEQDVFDEKYAYDALDRLTGVERGHLYCGEITSATLTQDWDLDALGNWDEFSWDPDGAGSGEEATQGREHDAANQITVLPGGITPAYDAAGNMVRGPKPGEAAASGAKGQNYTYDAWNRLVKVEEWTWTDTDEDGVFEATEKSTPVPVAEYQYDGLGRRIVKLVYDAPSEHWARTDYYYNEDWQVLEERVATDLAPANKGTPAAAAKVQYLWDPRYIDTPVCRWRDADPNVAGLEEVLYYTTDANFNVTALVSASGAVVERYVYDAYGTVTVLNVDWSPRTVNSSSVANEVLYTGAPLDAETSLYCLRARYLHPSLGQFTSQDPLGLAGGNANLYGYASSNPVARVDPMGRQDILSHLFAGMPEDLYLREPSGYQCANALGYGGGLSLYRGDASEQARLEVRDIARSFFEQLPSYDAGVSEDWVRAKMTEWAILNSDAFVRSSLAEHDRLRKYQAPVLGSLCARYFQVYDNARYGKLSDDAAQGLALLVSLADFTGVTAFARSAGVPDPVTRRVAWGEQERLEQFALGTFQVATLFLGFRAPGAFGAAERGVLKMARGIPGELTCEDVLARLAQRQASELAAEWYASGQLQGIGRSVFTRAGFADEVFARYQRYIDDAYAATMRSHSAGRLSVPQGMSAETAIGQEVDGAARADLLRWLRSEGILEGPGKIIQVNRYLRDPLGSGAYRIPDIRVSGSGLIFEGTISPSKSIFTPQLADFRMFSRGDNILIVRPTQLGGSYGLVFP